MSTTSETPTTKLARRDCPVCGGSEVRLIYTQRFEDMSVGLLSGYDVVVCVKCGMGFADRIPPQSAFDAYYRDLSKYENEHRGGQESDADEHRLRDVADRVESFIPSKNARVLEIGCATGRLLALLKEDGVRDVFGVDPAPGCAEAAQRLYGIKVFTNTISDVNDDERYDFVILCGVVEHIRDVKPALAGLRKLLARNGRIFIEVPDAVHPLARQDAPFQEFSTEHINFFSTVSLTNLVEDAGFKKVFCGYEMRVYLEGNRAPVVCGVFERTDEPRAGFERDEATEHSLRHYVAKCNETDEHLKDRIARAIASHKRVVVWGVGTHTRRLLATGGLNSGMIAAFIDSNPKYQGQDLHGIPIMPPELLRDFTEPVLISSYNYQKEIARQIRNELQAENKLIFVYPEIESADSVPKGVR